MNKVLAAGQNPSKEPLISFEEPAASPLWSGASKSPGRREAEIRRSKDERIKRKASGREFSRITQTTRVGREWLDTKTTKRETGRTWLLKKFQEVDLPPKESARFKAAQLETSKAKYLQKLILNKYVIQLFWMLTQLNAAERTG